jgi:hypothetical protein
LIASVVFSIGTLFCSIPYVGQLTFLLGLTAANWLALRDAGAFSTAARPAEFSTRRNLAGKRRGVTMPRAAG